MVTDPELFLFSLSQGIFFARMSVVPDIKIINLVATISKGGRLITKWMEDLYHGDTTICTIANEVLTGSPGACLNKKSIFSLAAVRARGANQWIEKGYPIETGTSQQLLSIATN